MKQNENVKIIGKGVVLVPYKKTHVPKYHEWMQSPELQELTASEPLNLEEEYEMQESWHTDENKCTFIILEKCLFEQNKDEIGAMVGDTNLFLSENSSVAEAEIMIAEESARGKGYGKEALLLMLTYACNTLPIHKFIAKIGCNNESSKFLFTKLGFSFVSKSEIFQEITLERVVDDGWKQWLYNQTKGLQLLPYNPEKLSKV